MIYQVQSIDLRGGRKHIEVLDVDCRRKQRPIEKRAPNFTQSIHRQQFEMQSSELRIDTSSFGCFAGTPRIEAEDSQ